MPPGDGFTEAQRATLGQSVAATEQATGLRVLLHVGRLDGGRAAAVGLLAACGDDAPVTVVVAVDPAAHGLEIVTGPRAAVLLDDRTCALAALAMTSSFVAGDLVGGIRNGLQVLADHGRNTRTPHLSTF